MYFTSKFNNIRAVSRVLQTEEHAVGPQGLALQAVHHQHKLRENYFSAMEGSASCRNTQDSKHLQTRIHLFIGHDLHCTPLAILAYKLFISSIKSSFRFEQSHVTKP